MARLRNVSQLGDLEIAVTGQIIAHGATDEVDNALVASLIAQGHFELADATPATADSTTSTTKPIEPDPAH